jgi:hypothetical protein
MSPSEPSMGELIERIMQATRQVRAAHRELYGDDVPYDLDPGYWAFVGPTDLSREQFEARVREREEGWDAGAVVLRRPQVVLLYQAPPKGPDARWQAADLRAQGEHFTAGELLYGFYRAAAADLDGGDKQAFQGFEFVGFIGSTPVYRAFLGG